MKRLLIVEDEPALARAFLRGLRIRGTVQGEAVEHANKALAQIEEGTVPDLILSDVDGSGGIKLFETLLKDHPELATPERFVFMTGRLFGGSRNRINDICDQHGIKVFEKPFSLNDVLEQLGVL